MHNPQSGPSLADKMGCPYRFRWPLAIDEQKLQGAGMLRCQHLMQPVVEGQNRLCILAQGHRCGTVCKRRLPQLKAASRQDA